MARLTQPSDAPGSVYWDIDGVIHPGSQSSRVDVLLVQFLLQISLRHLFPGSHPAGERLRRRGPPRTRIEALLDHPGLFTGVADLQTSLGIVEWKQLTYGQSDGQINPFNGRVFNRCGLRSLAMLQVYYAASFDDGPMARLGPDMSSFNRRPRQLPRDPRCPTELAARLDGASDTDPLPRLYEALEAIDRQVANAARAVARFRR